MILDVDKALLSLFRREVLGGARVNVVFDVPSRPWIQGVKGPTINLLLYDVRENVGAREVMPETIRDESGMVIGRRPPARRFDLYYVVSVWGVPIAAEHQLMSAVIGGLSELSAVPDDHLTDGLKEGGHAVFISIADGMRRGMLPNLSGETKLQLELAVTASMPPRVVQPVGVPVRSGMELRARSEGVDETVTVSQERRGLVQVLTGPTPTPSPADQPPNGAAPATNGSAPEKSAADQAPQGKAPEGKAPEGKAPEGKAPQTAGPAEGAASTAPAAQQNPPADATRGTTAAEAAAMTDAARAKQQQQVQQAVAPTGAAPATKGAAPAQGKPAGGAPPGNPMAQLGAALAQAAQAQAALAQAIAGVAGTLAGQAPKPLAPPASSSQQPPATQPPATQPPATQPPATQPPADATAKRAAKPRSSGKPATGE